VYFCFFTKIQRTLVCLSVIIMYLTNLFVMKKSYFFKEIAKMPNPAPILGHFRHFFAITLKNIWFWSLICYHFGVVFSVMKGRNLSLRKNYLQNDSFFSKSCISCPMKCLVFELKCIICKEPKSLRISNKLYGEKS